MKQTLPHWYLIGTGNIGVLSAHYLQQAGHGVTALRPGNDPMLHRELVFGDQPRRLTLPAMSPARLARPLDALLVACKTPFTRDALLPLQPWLHQGTLVVRLQNGMGALDGLLPDGGALIETVTTSAVKGRPPRHEVVAENDTWWGGLPQPPVWFEALRQHWPGLHWEADLRHRQWQKLVVNAVINPLTALHDVDNGALLNNPALLAQANALCREADALLTRLDPHWPANSLPNVLAVARATAGNTSSMRADRQRGNRTEIDAINGYLLRQAEPLGMDLPHHRQLVQALS
ncbi:2-dehydropantoate 2-reductase [Alcanivorax hongdengensis A-11-3]|uniref:2-dehydropantoate 2-reductase n=1 Tax=Alcanivorax hongdengensis A-11-3 TaxID=1177179 RepID=L0WBS5_9GAMM|nr:2-dehydropantoate 2-reductase [Alcanivorax hongdengensis]EKF74233.1 2-dehydropantoate 2-reductase [Alcanivorax hongdengensis A-11-3]